MAIMSLKNNTDYNIYWNGHEILFTYPKEPNLKRTDHNRLKQANLDENVRQNNV